MYRCKKSGKQSIFIHQAFIIRLDFQYFDTEENVDYLKVYVPNTFERECMSVGRCASFSHTFAPAYFHTHMYSTRHLKQVQW